MGSVCLAVVGLSRLGPRWRSRHAFKRQASEQYVLSIDPENAVPHQLQLCWYRAVFGEYECPFLNGRLPSAMKRIVTHVMEAYNAYQREYMRKRRKGPLGIAYG